MIRWLLIVSCLVLPHVAVAEAPAVCPDEMCYYHLPEGDEDLIVCERCLQDPAWRQREAAYQERLAAEFAEMEAEIKTLEAEDAASQPTPLTPIDVTEGVPDRPVS